MGWSWVSTYLVLKDQTQAHSSMLSTYKLSISQIYVLLLVMEGSAICILQSGNQGRG